MQIRTHRATLIAVGAALLVVAAAVIVTSLNEAPAPLPPGPTVAPAAPAPCALPAPTTPRVWEVPAAEIPTSPSSDKWAERIWRYADDNETFSPSIETGVDETPGNDYSIPLYCADQATTIARVFERPSWPGTFESGTTIPWNPNWRPSDGRDGFMVIVDPTTGKEWDIWALSTPQFHPADYLPQFRCALDLKNQLDGFNSDESLCAAALMVVSNPSGDAVDVRTYRGNYPPANGVGLQNTAGLTTPNEVAAGRIPHALKFAVGGQASMSGPPCPADVTSPDDARIGTVCGVSVAPAAKLESASTTAAATPCEVRSRKSACLGGMTPDGTRWVVDVTDAEIDAWLDERGYAGRLRETARVFAVALRDFGSIQSDTTGGPANWQVAGGADAETARAWRKLGVTQKVGDTLLDGLITRERIRVLAPPTNHCAEGGDSQLACWANDITYPGQ
ncbi:MAG: hypothetical protein IT195_11955 [Microthrixaceae bacterium]|nr:hypothetical protein [Microthrixaceae bacterium]